MKFTIDIQEIKNETEIENSRNDSYLLIDKNKKSGFVVTYANHLIEKINDNKLLDINIPKNCLTNDAKFRELISKLDDAGYSVFQLTRL